MTKYIVKEASIEVGYKKASIESGCTIGVEDTTPAVIAAFDTYEEALQELAKHESSIQYPMSNHGTSYAYVTEYYIEKEIYDEDGDWMDGEFLDTTEMPAFDWEA